MSYKCVFFSIHNTMENITLNIKEENDNKERKRNSSYSKRKEVIRFYYFSELGLCGDDKGHQHYCDKMISHGYTLIKITPLGNLDNNRDSYEGTLIYHWKLNKDE